MKVLTNSEHHLKNPSSHSCLSHSQFSFWAAIQTHSWALLRRAGPSPPSAWVPAPPCGPHPSPKEVSCLLLGGLLPGTGVVPLSPPCSFPCCSSAWRVPPRDCRNPACPSGPSRSPPAMRSNQSLPHILSFSDLKDSATYLLSLKSIQDLVLDEECISPCKLWCYKEKPMCQQINWVMRCEGSFHYIFPVYAFSVISTLNT